MNLDKMTLVYGTMFVFSLILICVSENTLLNTSAYAQTLDNNSNGTSGYFECQYGTNWKCYWL